MKDYASMTDAQFYVECELAVRHMTGAIARVASETGKFARGLSDNDKDGHHLISCSLEFSMQTMLNGLGDILNGLDAATDEDKWTDAIFDEMRRRFPADA